MKEKVEIRAAVSFWFLVGAWAKPQKLNDEGGQGWVCAGAGGQSGGGRAGAR
jgi:hypothetical protein